MTSHPEAQTAVRSCVAAAGMTPCVSNASPNASASLSGAAPWSARTVRTRWTYTHASLTRDPIGWIEPEVGRDGPILQLNYPPVDGCQYKIDDCEFLPK